MARRQPGLAAVAIPRENTAMTLRKSAFAALVIAAAFASGIGRASAIEAQYDKQLLRLAELFGSLHYLRNLCGETGNTWREHMEALLVAEEPEPENRARLVASFNHGYRSFGSVYTTCTASAVEAIERYMLEGETLTRDLVSRFGN
ncbi:MAG: TIGR02301 family protein [Rhizobiaceae bacterium]